MKQEQTQQQGILKHSDSGMLHLKLQYSIHGHDQDGPINPSHTHETIFNVKHLFYSQNLQNT
jgi:hypothetical protein